uniref:Laminin EGF-like domain-containing protein n=1 Tax=Macrostomum lignano TaxID=282301 RepID=A0A1I8I3S8_9PLAT
MACQWKTVTGTAALIMQFVRCHTNSNKQTSFHNWRNSELGCPGQRESLGISLHTENTEFSHGLPLRIRLVSLRFSHGLSRSSTMHLTLALLLLLTAAVVPSGSSACWRIAPSSQCANRSLLSLRPEDSGSPTFTACAQRCLFTSGCAARAARCLPDGHGCRDCRPDARRLRVRPAADRLSFSDAGLADWAADCCIVGLNGRPTAVLWG